MHQSEHVICETGGVGVMLFDPQIRLVIQQSVEHISGVPHADIDGLCMKRGVLIGNVRIKQNAGFVAVFRIDPTGCFRAAAGLESLPV